jgi:hypothetical protein
MSMKEKTRRWGSANALMSEPGIRDAKRKVLGFAPKHPDRARTHRASRCIVTKVAPQPSTGTVMFNRANFIMGW